MKIPLPRFTFFQMFKKPETDPNRKSKIKNIYYFLKENMNMIAVWSITAVSAAAVLISLGIALFKRPLADTTKKHIYEFAVRKILVRFKRVLVLHDNFA